MSMPQQGPPDPHTPGPVSGGPQSPYDPQGAPPPYQPTSPPPSFHQPGPAAAVRPPMLMLGAIGTAVLALLFLVRVVSVFLDVGTDYSLGSGATFVYAAYFLAMAVAAGAGAAMAMMGTDFGRIFAAAVAGASMWEAAEWWQSVIASLTVGHGFDTEHFPWLPAIISMIGGFVGIAVVVAMAMPAIGIYIAEKRGKPAAGAPPAGPMPSGPGMPPPPGQQPGQTYGAPPPAGQQPGQTYGQPQPGSPYGEQPPGAPPPGQQY